MRVMGLLSMHLDGIVSSRRCLMPRGVYVRPTAHDRFWAKVDKTGDCWIWLGSMLKDGYGNFNEGRKTIPAHRFSFKEFIGPIPTGKLVRHTCDNPSCVRPSHLVLGTQKDNCADAVERGRNVRGESHGMSKITASKALEVKVALASGRGLKDVALLTGVAYSTVNDIKRGRAWSWV